MSPQALAKATQAAAKSPAPKVIYKQAIALSAGGAILGPLCDGQHSQYHVLEYTDPTLISLPWLHWQLQTCWWVPILFGMAAIILGLSHPYLDVLAKSYRQAAPVNDLAPSWSKVTLGIATFVLQYAASGFLEQPLLHQSLGMLPYLDVILCSSSVLQWYTFDRTWPGLFMASLTALAGPAVEMFLIRQLHLYHYNHAGPLGVPSWIAWVYFCGSPAVGNLGRKVRAQLLSQKQQ